MALVHDTVTVGARPAPWTTLEAIFDALSDGRLLARLWVYRINGRPGWPLRPLWRAYVASFFLHMNSTNDLIRRLEQDAELRGVCGFGDVLPHRTTFNRFIARLSRHGDLVEQIIVAATGELRAQLPDLGDEVAIDSTTVYTHANPNRTPRSDPDASWTAKNSSSAPSGKEWRYGYKLHMAVDANHGIPLAVHVTTASRNDSPELPPLVDRMGELLPWCQPRYAMADRGYDAKANYLHLYERGTIPIILTRKNANNRLYEGIYTKEGVPMCIGMVPMEYVRSDPERGHLYRCVGCHLANTKGRRNCDLEYWENWLEGDDTGQRLRLLGPVQRQTPEWAALYSKRQSVERTFKSLKQSRRLERHCARGLRKVTLHCLMSVLVYQATVLVKAHDGAWSRLRWMVDKLV